MKRVCLVANSAFTILNFRRELIQLFRTRGCEVYVVCPSECPLVGDVDICEEFSRLGVIFRPVSLSRSGLNPLNELSTLWGIYRQLNSIKPCLVMNYTIKPTIYASVAAFFCSVTTIVSNITGLGYVFTDKGIKAKVISGIVKLQYRVSLFCNNVVFFQNPDDRELFLKLGLVSSEKTRLINGSGVDTKKFLRKDQIVNATRFLFVGRLLKDKGIHEYIEAAKIVKLKYPAVSFSIVGAFDDNPNALSSQDINEIERQGFIKYLGTTRKMVEVYEQHDVFVLPSYREGTPRSTLEALSMGMPIITTDAPGCRETVRNRVNGYLVSLNNADEIAQAMICLIRDPGIVQKYSKASRAMALEKYDVDAVNEYIASEIGVSAREVQAV